MRIVTDYDYDANGRKGSSTLRPAAIGNHAENELIMLLSKGEKIHVIHRRLFDKDIRKHFLGEVEDFEDGLVRAVGHVFVIEDAKENVFRKKPDARTRIISLHDGAVIVNVLPPSVNLDLVNYESTGRSLRITDGSDWHLDIKEFGWS